MKILTVYAFCCACASKKVPIHNIGSNTWRTGSNTWSRGSPPCYINWMSLTQVWFAHSLILVLLLLVLVPWVGTDPSATGGY